ncbi:hypothetical protein X975_14016, partial [Stegodyphus mimosarum]
MDSGVQLQTIHLVCRRVLQHHGDRRRSGRSNVSGWNERFSFQVGKDVLMLSLQKRIKLPKIRLLNL